MNNSVEFTPEQNEPGHYVEVNGHKIFGYSRYIDLYRAVVDRAEDGAHFVEVGSFLGQSTAAMAAMIIGSGKRIRFDAVDLFELTNFSDEPHYEVIKRHGGDFMAAFKHNLKAAGVLDKVNIKQGYSTKIARQYEDRTISYLMVDASHDYADVVDDIVAWMPKLKVGGIMSGDDFDWEEVRQAVYDTLGKENIQEVGTSWVYIKTKNDI
jgi:hypothetical protein